jgi:hypothetical protein
MLLFDHTPFCITILIFFIYKTTTVYITINKIRIYYGAPIKRMDMPSMLRSSSHQEYLARRFEINRRRDNLVHFLGVPIGTKDYQESPITLSVIVSGGRV